MIKYVEYGKRRVFMDKILLEIKGTQRYGRESDVLELTTYGTLRDDGAAYIIRYKEEQEPPQKPVTVTVRVQKDESCVEMTRLGNGHSSLYIEKSKRNLCRYGTEFGDMLMGVYGRDIEADLENGCFNFEYDIDFNGSVASQNTVKMQFTKTKHTNN